MGSLISSAQISKFPLTADGEFIRKCVLELIPIASQASESRFRVSYSLYSAFLHIVGISRERWLDYDTLLSFKGFLLIDVDANLSYSNLVFSTTLQMLTSVGSKYERLHFRQSEEDDEWCKAKYLDMKRDPLLLEYYAGWSVTTLDERVVYADLKELYRIHGAEVARRVHRALREYGSRFNKATYGAKSTLIVQVIDALCKLLPDGKSFELLKDKGYVNQIFEGVMGVMATEFEITSSRGANDRLFEKKWKSVRHEIYAFFIDKGLVSKPIYPIIRGKIRAPASKAMKARNINELDAVGTFGVLTPVPLHIKDEQAAKVLYEQIVDDLELMKEACEAAKGASWYHFCFPHPGVKRYRYPIEDISLKKLYAAAESLGSYEVQQRNKLILSVYEHTGARQGEGANILVADIIRALEEGAISPSIRIITYKRRMLHERWVSVPRLYVQQWMDYINTTRLLCIADNNLVDHGYLFINAKTGKKLSCRTISNVMSDLRIAAQIESRAHVHMFRHRFITNKLKMIMQQFDFENQDSFRRALADFGSFREQLKQWAGHARIESLERYIHLACSELADVGLAVDHALQAEAFRAIRVEFDRIKGKLDRGEITEREYGNLMQKTLLDGTGVRS